jgi:hypothetical protein
MEFICNDINGPTKWYYNRDENRYYRMQKDGEVRYFLDAENLADPAKILEQGKQPQESTIKLWEHKIANLNT